MNETIEAICIWYDNVSSLGEGKWIVSWDRLNAVGEAETSRTLDVCATQEEAESSGRIAAEKRRLPLYRNPLGGPVELVAGCGR